MKQFFRKIGKFIIILTQKHEHQICQSVSVVDGERISIDDFVLIVADVKEKFKNANLVVLTQRDKEDVIRRNFPDVQIIAAEKIAKISSFKLTISLTLLLRKSYRFIILSALDAPLVFISLVFGRCPVILRNRWREWHCLRLKNVLDLLRSARSIDGGERKKGGPGYVLKKLGKPLVIIADLAESGTRQSTLVVDNGYTDIGHVSTAVRRAYVIFINPDITVLTFAARKHYFASMFPQAKLVILEEPVNRHSLAGQMRRIRGQKFNYVILTTLDISPLIAAMTVMKAKVFLYNKWHQWWSLDFRSAWGYLKKPLSFLITIPFFGYLLFKVAFVLLRTFLRLAAKDLKEILFRKETGEYETN